MRTVPLDAPRRRLLAVAAITALALGACARGVDSTSDARAVDAELVADVSALGLDTATIVAEGEVVDPTVAIDANGGAVYVAWIQPSSEGGGHHEAASGHHEDSSEDATANAVYVARSSDGGASFSDPVIVAADEPGTEAPISSHSGGPVQVAVGPDEAVHVLWGVNESHPDAEFGLTTMFLARSDDGGASFSEPQAIGDDLELNSTNFHNLFVDPDGGIHIGFLDYRESYDDDEAAAVQVRVMRSDDGGETFPASTQVGELSCECCRVDFAMDSEGDLLLGWRQIFPRGDGDPVRDLVVARSADGGTTWSEAATIHDDGWAVSQCPHTGPVLAFDSAGGVDAAWYTGRDGGAGIYYAESDDGGQSFGEPVALFTDEWVPYSVVSLAVDDDDNAWVAWEDLRQDEPRVGLARVAQDGSVTAVDGPVGSGLAPRLASAAGHVVLTWSDGEQLHVLSAAAAS